MGKIENNKFGLNNLPNRNGEYLIGFSFENSLSCLDNKKRKKKKRRENYVTTSTLNNAKGKLCYVTINKWI